MTSLARQSQGLNSKKQRTLREPQLRVPWLISAWCLAFAFVQPPLRVTAQATAKIPPAAIGDGCLLRRSNSSAASAVSIATGLTHEGSCKQDDSPAKCCQANNTGSVTWPPQSPKAFLLGGSLHEKVTGPRPTAPAVNWMLIRSDTQGHVDVQGNRSLNQATNTHTGSAAGHLNLTIDAANRVTLTWNSINPPTDLASLASYHGLAHETSPGQFIVTNQASNHSEGLIDITVASYPGSIHKPCGMLMYHYKYRLQNVWPSDGAIIQEVSYYKSIVPCAKWRFFVKSNQEGASQIRLERLDHYFEAFPTIERGQREDDHPDGVDAAPPEHVADHAGGEEEGGQGEGVGVDHPLQIAEVGVQRGLDRRQCDVDDRHVQQQHERAHTHCDQGPPLAIHRC